MPLEDIVRKTTPLEDFDRDNFVNYLEAYQKVEEYLKILNDPKRGYSERQDAKQDLGELLFSDPQIAKDLPLESVFKSGSRFLDKETNAIAAYSKRNLNTLLSKLNDEEMYTLVISLPGISRVNKEHDEIAKSVNEWLKIKEASQSEHGIVAYVNEQAKKFPEWFRDSYNPSDAQVFFSAFAKYAQEEIQEKLIIDKKTRKIDRKKTEDFYRNNIKKAEEEYDKEPNPKDKKDIMDKYINPRYVSVAQLAYPSQEKEKKLDKEKDRGERKAERREIGMP